jgi:ferredoxin-NADP reductase
MMNTLSADVALVDRPSSALRGGTAVEDATVRRVTWEADGVVSLDLIAPDGRALPAWEPGAHVELRLPSGLIRPYSLCGDPADRRTLRVAVRLEDDGRGGSAEIHGSALVGRRLPVLCIRNDFALVDAPAYLFVAGGIGITPLLPMIDAAARRGAPWRAIYRGRQRHAMPFLDRLAGYGDLVEISAAEHAARPDWDRVVAAAASGTAVYACGPASLLDAVRTATQIAGGRSYCAERFAAAPPPDVDDTARPDAPVTVELARSGREIVVPPGQTILDALLDVMPDVEFSCQDGYCGTCETGVLAGTPDHRDSYLTPGQRAAGDRIMICTSRACGERIVLDL